jgi:hypothetical protein
MSIIGRRRHRVTRLVVLVTAVAAMLISACAPTKKVPPPSPPQPGEFIAHYLTLEVATFTGFRSSAPHSRPVGAAGTATQTLLADGSVALDITGLASGDGSVASGFVTVPFRFGDFRTLRIDLVAGSDETVVSLLMFDTDGDGQFAEWDAAGGYVGPSADLSAQCLDAVSSTATIEDSTVCTLIDANGAIGTFTVAELKAGAQAGLGANTPASASVILTLDARQAAEAHSVVSAFVLNGSDLLVP